VGAAEAAMLLPLWEGLQPRCSPLFGLFCRRGFSPDALGSLVFFVGGASAPMLF
jgi:hypothetical protein